MARTSDPASVDRGRMTRHPIDLRGPIGQWSAPVAGRIIAASPSTFFGEGQLVELGDVSVIEVRVAPLRYASAAGMPDVVDVVSIVSGTSRYSSPGGRRDVGAGSVVFSRPTHGDVLEVPVESVLLHATIPASRLRPDLLPARDLPLVEVAPEHSAAFVTVLTGIIGAPRRYGPSTSAALHDAVVELAEAVLAESTGQRRPAPGGSLLDRAKQHIDLALTDPRTTPVTVAASLGVSIRALHLAFEHEEMTAARYIRHRRLVEVDRALSSGNRETVKALARRFGFGNPDRLARAYRKAHGHSIGERDVACGQAGAGITAGTGRCSAGTPPA